jgi:uncharacterized membrane protein YqiK
MTMIVKSPQPDITEMTIQAVDEIGETAAIKIEAAADAFERKAKADAERIANNMRQLAETIREHGKVASAHIKTHCDRSEDVGATVKELAERIAPKPKAIVNGHDDGKPIPQFLEAGPRTMLAELGSAPGADAS